MAAACSSGRTWLRRTFDSARFSDWPSEARAAMPANLYPAGRSGEQVERSFVIDVGTNGGVQPGAPVVAPAGLVGVIRVASPNQAIGDFWTHRDFRASAMTADGSAFGIIRSLGERPLLMRLDGIPFQAELAPGPKCNVGNGWDLPARNTYR